MFEDRFNTLKRRVVEYAGLVEAMIEKAVKGLLENERDLLIEVIEKDEPRANSLEMEVDELGTSLIAQFQPKAKDLRALLMIMKMGNDLEFCCDVCEADLDDGNCCVLNMQDLLTRSVSLFVCTSTTCC